MKLKERYIIILIVLILFAVNYNSLNGFLVKNFSGLDTVQVERVIDGDTVVVNGTSVRLLGINAPETGEKYSKEAKEFLEKLVMNKNLKIEKKGKDLYYRDLAYLFDGNLNINLELVKNGYANYYFPKDKDKYYRSFVLAWNECSENLCLRSTDVCSKCIDLELNVKEDEIILENTCSFSCDLTSWSVKDEGRKKFIFDDYSIGRFEKKVLRSEDFGKSYVLTKSGDSVFVRDSLGKIVNFESY